MTDKKAMTTRIKFSDCPIKSGDIFRVEVSRKGPTLQADGSLEQEWTGVVHGSEDGVYIRLKDGTRIKGEYVNE